MPIMRRSESYVFCSVAAGLSALASAPTARRRRRRGQGKGRTVRRLSRRWRHFADGEHSLAGRPARSVHSVAAGVLPRRLAQERADAADRRADQQRRYPHSRRLFRLADAAQSFRSPTTIPICRRRARRPPSGRRCASCHTDSYAGTKAVARLAGQREEYLVKALHDYKSGVRSGGAGAAMTDVAYPLSDEEITALAHYLAHL